LDLHRSKKSIENQLVLRSTDANTHVIKELGSYTKGESLLSNYRLLDGSSHQPNKSKKEKEDKKENKGGKKKGKQENKIE
jgi:hypothetical protein